MLIPDQAQLKYSEVVNFPLPTGPSPQLGRGQYYVYASTILHSSGVVFIGARFYGVCPRLTRSGGEEADLPAGKMIAVGEGGKICGPAAM